MPQQIIILLCPAAFKSVQVGGLSKDTATSFNPTI